RYPQQNDRRLSLAQYIGSLAAAYNKRGRVDEARQQFQKSKVLMEELSASIGDSIDMLNTLGSGQLAGADEMAAADHIHEAQAMYDSAETTLNRLVELAPRLGEGHLALCNLYMSRANNYEADGRLVDAIFELDRVNAKAKEIAQLATVPWMQT